VKNLLIAVGVLATFATSAAAQGPSFGIKAGATLNSVSIDFTDGTTAENKNGGMAGVFLQFPANSRFTFQPEVLWVMKGAKLKQGTDSVRLSFDEIEVPLLANVNLTGGPTPLCLIVGPFIGFRTSAELKQGLEKQDLKDDTESTDFGVVTGAAFQAGPVVIDGRYNWGLSNINKAKDEGEVKTRTFTISLGIRF